MQRTDCRSGRDLPFAFGIWEVRDVQPAPSALDGDIRVQASACRKIMGPSHLKTLGEKVTIQENGKCRVMTKLEASMKQLVNKAASGDLRALCFLVGITRDAEQSAGEQTGAKDVLNDLDRKVLMNIIQRYSNSMKEVKHDETPDD
jgi:Family of unknown function (DUF5681)